MRGWKKDFSGIEEPNAPLTALDLQEIVVIFPLFPYTELD